MPTISRHWPKRAPRGDYAARCDYCGVNWRRSQMVRKSNGMLACPDDAPGMDEVELSEGNAAAASAMRGPQPKYDGAAMSTSNDVPDADIAAAVGRVTFGNGAGH